MKKIILVALVVILTYACSKEDNITKSSPEADEIYDMLMAAYELNSSEKLKSLIDNWGNSVHPYQYSVLKNETERDIYKIFKEIYSPFNIDKLGWHEWGSSMYEGYDYIVVQNRVDYDFEYGTDAWPKPDSVTDFRPDIHFGGVTTLYLAKEYDIAINVFLGSEFNPLGTGGIMNPAVPSEESAARYNFLKQYLAIIPGHWGGYWHIETHPEVSRIRFDLERKRAKASFRVGYMFGDALLEKNDDKWDIVSSEINGIE